MIFQGPFGLSSGGGPYAEDVDSETTTSTRIGGDVARVGSNWSRRTALLIVGGLCAASLMPIALAPAPVAFALTAGLAAAWCIWLERHPDAL